MESIRILTGTEICRDDILQAVQLDRISYEDLYQLQADTCIAYHQKNPYIYLMAAQAGTGRIVGYLNFSPVRESLFRQLASGEVVDTVITGDDVEPYRGPGEYWGYFSSIVVHPDFRRQGVAARLLHSWVELVLWLAQKHSIRFSGIVADAVSEGGTHLLAEAGFTLVRSSRHDSRIMLLDLTNPHTPCTSLNAPLLALYQSYPSKGGVLRDVSI